MRSDEGQVLGRPNIMQNEVALMDDEVSEALEIGDIISFYRRPALDMYKSEMLSRALQRLLKMPTAHVMSPEPHSAIQPRTPSLGGPPAALSIKLAPGARALS